MKFSTLKQQQQDNLAQENAFGGLPKWQKSQSNQAKALNFINSSS